MKKMNEKIIVAHPLKQHSFHTAIGLKREGLLYKYITTTYVTEHSVTGKLLNVLKGDTLKKAKSRSCNELNEDVLQFCELENLIYLGMLRIPWLKTFRRWYIRKIIGKFGKKVAKYAISNNVDAVIMYDTTATECFRYLEKNAPHIKRILDVTMCTATFTRKNLEYDITSKDINAHYKESDFLWNDIEMINREEELRLSQYFIGASGVVKDSLIYCNINDEKIYTVPYGVDKNKFEFNKKDRIKMPLKMLFVGQVNYRKGVHHLLEVVSTMNKDEVELYIAGSLDKNFDISRNYEQNENIYFKGFVTRDQLPKLYKDCDIFVFPSSGEGYGLVVLEALSSGLPCIVSNLVGGKDIIEDGKNGFVVNFGDYKGLENRIKWFIDNPDSISTMSLNSYKSVENLSWLNYYDNIANVIKNILDSR